MIIASIALALAPIAADTTAQEISYDELLGCYGSFMVSKGLNMDSPEKLLAKYDRAARRKCAAEVKKHKALVGPKRFEDEWAELWGEWLSRI